MGENETGAEELIESTGNAMVLAMVRATSGIVVCAIISLLSWFIYETIENRQYRKTNNYLTLKQAYELELRIENRFASLPPPETKNELAKLREDVNQLAEKIIRLQIIQEKMGHR